MGYIANKIKGYVIKGLWLAMFGSLVIYSFTLAIDILIETPKTGELDVWYSTGFILSFGCGVRGLINELRK